MSNEIGRLLKTSYPSKDGAVTKWVTSPEKSNLVKITFSICSPMHRSFLILPSNKFMFNGSKMKLVRK